VGCFLAKLPSECTSAGHGFQTVSDLVIPLDLTGNIAFDAFREVGARHTRRKRCGVPGMGWYDVLRASRENGIASRRNSKGFWV
jgi:hypothetical protein